MKSGEGLSSGSNLAQLSVLLDMLQENEAECELRYEGTADPVSFKMAMLPSCYYEHYMSLTKKEDGIQKENLKALYEHLTIMADNIENPLQKSKPRYELEKCISTKEEESQRMKDLAEKIRNEQAKKDDSKLTAEEKMIKTDSLARADKLVGDAELIDEGLPDERTKLKALVEKGTSSKDTEELQQHLHDEMVRKICALAETVVGNQGSGFGSQFFVCSNFCIDQREFVEGCNTHWSWTSKLWSKELLGKVVLFPFFQNPPNTFS